MTEFVNHCLQVSPKHLVPVRALWLPIFLVMILALLNIASSAAFGAFIALASLGLFSSYLIAIGCMLYARLSKEGVKYGGWELGRWGVPINIYAMIYSGYIMVFLPFPSSLPVTATNMNYALPIFGLSIVVPLFLWFFWARKHWKGLDADVVGEVLAESDIEMK